MSLAILRIGAQDREVTNGETDLDPRRWPALAACVSALFITLLDVSIVNVALPSIGRSTGADASELQWGVSGYALAFGMVPIIGGRLGDDRGRKPMVLIGVASFVGCSALVGSAPTPGVLILGRVLQGLAGGLLNPQVSGIVQQLFPPGERAKAFGALGAAVGIATAAGPVVGGLIIAVGGSEFGWRLCFLVNVPIGILSLVLCARLLPPHPRGTAPALSTFPARRCWPWRCSGCCSRPSSSTPVTTCAWLSWSCPHWPSWPASWRGSAALRPAGDIRSSIWACSGSGPMPTGSSWPCSSSAPTPARRWSWRCSCRRGSGSRLCNPV